MRLQNRNLRALLAALLITSLWCAVGAAPASAAEPQRWALLVGVGDNIRPAFSLYGPKNDVPAVADLLHGQYDFPASHIRRLLNQDATRKNILDGWAWLARNAHAGDLVVFYYSGHGTAIPEQVPGSEPNGVDSALCPYDAVDRSGLIPGSEIGKCIDRLPTNQVVVIVDACNSGHATRDIRTRQRALSPRDFGLPAASDTLLSPSEAANAPTATFAGATLAAPNTHKEMYIGAARIDQKAVEGPFLDLPMENSLGINAARGGADARPGDGPRGNVPTANPNMGAMTHFLLQELRAASGEGDAATITYGELIQRVRRDLRQEYGDEAQEPQISGPDPDITPFLAERRAAPRYASRQKANALPVAVALTTGAGPGESVQLRAVAGATLVPGSILQVGGDRRWTESEDEQGGSGVNGTRDVTTAPTGLVRVINVRGARATGIVLSGKASMGLAMTEALRPAPDGRLRVAIGGAGPIAERLRGVASGVEDVVVVGAALPSDVTLYPSEKATTDLGHAVDVYRGGVALPSIAEADVAATLVDLQRVNRLANLQSPSDAPLHLTVSLNDSEGFAKARIGDKVRYRISADRDAYITILDLTADGTIVGATRPGKLRAGEVWSLADIPVVAPTGLDTLKVIATTFPVTMDLPANAVQATSMGTAGGPAAVAQRVLDALGAGSIAEAERNIPALNAAAIGAVTTSNGTPNPIATNGWVCADQLLRIDP